MQNRNSAISFNTTYNLVLSLVIMLCELLIKSSVNSLRKNAASAGNGTMPKLSLTCPQHVNFNVSLTANSLLRHHTLHKAVPNYVFSVFMLHYERELRYNSLRIFRLRRFFSPRIHTSVCYLQVSIATTDTNQIKDATDLKT